MIPLTKTPSSAWRMKAGSSKIAGLYPPVGGPLVPMVMIPMGLYTKMPVFIAAAFTAECAILKRICKQPRRRLRLTYR